MSVGALWLSLSITREKTVLADAPVPNAPIGVAKGIHPGEKIAIKVNFVGLIWGWEGTDPENYDLKNRLDYMNTSPQMILALLRQLVKTAGVQEADIAVGDGLANFPNQFHKILHDEFPGVQYLDKPGKFGTQTTRDSE